MCVYAIEVCLYVSLPLNATGYFCEIQTQTDGGARGEMRGRRGEMEGWRNGEMERVGRAERK